MNVICLTVAWGKFSSKALVKLCFIKQVGETSPVTSLFKKECHFNIIFLNVIPDKKLSVTSCNYHIFILHFHFILATCSKTFAVYWLFLLPIWMIKSVVVKVVSWHKNLESMDIQRYKLSWESKHFTKKPNYYAGLSSWSSLIFMIVAFYEYLLKQSFILKHS